MSPYINRHSVQRANARLMTAAVGAGVSGNPCACALDQARRLLRQHSPMSVEQAGRLAMQRMVGGTR